LCEIKKMCQNLFSRVLSVWQLQNTD